MGGSEYAYGSEPMDIVGIRIYSISRLLASEVYGVAGDYFCVAVRVVFCARIAGDRSVLDGELDILLSRDEEGGGGTTSRHLRSRW